MAQQQMVDTVANNLANSDTAAFKKDMPAFREYLATVENEHAAVDIPRGPIKDKEFYPLDGKDQAFVITDGTYTNFRQGNLRVTHSPFDLAIDGPGFFEVSTPNGVRYTRQGSLKVTKDGLLTTPEGYPVLAAQPGGLASALPATTAVQPSQGGPTTQGGVAAGQPTPPPETQARFVNLRDVTGQIAVTEGGDVYAGDRLIAKLALTEFQDSRFLRKRGGLLFENVKPDNVKSEPARSIVRQGVIETSNVNPIEEMTKLISAHRGFEHGMKAMKVHDEFMSKEANEIGKL